LDIIDIVSHKGGNVSYHDPFINKVKTNEGREFNSIDISTEALLKADCVVLTTNHSNLDMSLIINHANMIVDMRNMIKNNSEKVIKL
jgi:UDP-N-acetyl-D-glucosamine dehydrogenase